MAKSKLLRFAAGLGATVWLMGLLVVTAPPVQAATIVINAPVNGQEFTGNDFALSGTTDANSTVLVQKGASVLAYTKSDAEGKWTANLTGLPDGNNTITAKVVKNKGFLYAPSISSFPPSGSVINSIRLSDNAINPASPFPVTPTNFGLTMSPSPSSNVYYLANSFAPTIKPSKFDADNPGDPVEVTNYPDNPGVSAIGAYNLTGSKFYLGNHNLSNISVVGVASNTVSTNIAAGMIPDVAITSPQGAIYLTGATLGDPIKVLDPESDTIAKTITAPCSAASYLGPFIFSTDPTYPYYYVSCIDTGEIFKMNVGSDTAAESWVIPNKPTGGVLSPDNKKIYLFTSAATGNAESSNIRVIDTSTGAVTKSIALTGGILGFLSSPDFQKIYAGNLGNDFQGTGFDIVDTFTDTVTHVNSADTFAAITASPASTQEIANVNVSVVLGVKTATSNSGGSLAETGAAVSTTLLLGIIFGSLSYTYYDYRQHKKPLVAADPSAHKTYTYMHHIRTVTIPLMKYRLSFSLQREEDQGSRADHS